MKNKIKYSFNKQTLVNILVTYVEGFLAAWVVLDYSTETNALVGAAAAAGSAVWNTIIKPIFRT